VDFPLELVEEVELDLNLRPRKLKKKLNKRKKLLNLLLM
jgi:hypothetical protein